MGNILTTTTIIMVTIITMNIAMGIIITNFLGMEKGKIYGVALGPGDPELLTIKALRILREADRIYFPGSINPKGEKSSHSMKIMAPHSLAPEKMTGIYIKMSMDREQTERVYSHAFTSILADYQNGLKVAIVSEGDIAFFSTFAYLLDRIHANHLNFEMIAGIPAFILAGSVHRFPLALQSDKLAVLAQLNNLEELEQRLHDFETVVIIKLSTVKGEICNFIRKHQLDFFYGEKLGTDEQYTTTSIEELESRRIPYFSLMIFNKYIHQNR